jgi:hypothetical protein
VVRREQRSAADAHVVVSRRGVERSQGDSVVFFHHADADDPAVVKE